MFSYYFKRDEIENTYESQTTDLFNNLVAERLNAMVSETIRTQYLRKDTRNKSLQQRNKLPATAHAVSGVRKARGGSRYSI